MKVLFAVNNESISETIIKKYQKIYDVLLEYKNVYYYNAIVKEIQNESNYDIIVISEDLETISSNDKRKVDAFILDKLEKVIDVFKAVEINPIPILFISNEKRTIKNEIIPNMFNLGIYNALVEKDRTITKICELINSPRSEEEARQYYNLRGSNKVSIEKEIVNPKEINNILKHYKKIMDMPDRFSSSFDRIAAQYDDLQLKYIIDKLPEGVTAVLIKENQKYNEIINLKEEDFVKEQPVVTNSSAPKSSGVIVPTEISKGNVKSQTIDSPAITPRVEIEEKPIIENVKIPEEVKEQNLENTLEIEIEKEPEKEIIKDNKLDLNIPSKTDDLELKEETKPIIEEDSKSSSNEIVIEGTDDLDIFLDTDFDNENDDFIPIFGVEETSDLLEKENTEIVKETNSTKKEESKEASKVEQSTDLEISEVDDDINIFPEDISLDGIDFDSISDNAVEEIIPEETVFVSEPNVTKQTIVEEKNNDVFDEIPKKENDRLVPQGKKKHIIPDLSAVLSKDKKVVVFVGTSKNGTSFLVNSLGMLFASIGINTAILDMTKNKNSYYLSTKNDERLRQIAIESTSRLKEGVAMGVEVLKGLSIYTSLPGVKEEDSDTEVILSTLVKNYSLVLIDADFDTNFGYFSAAQEIYLVQSLDVLTIQPLTAFLKELLDARILTTEKVKVVLNKEVAVRGLTRKILVGGISTYNDPGMSIMTNLFDRNQVQVASIPFDQNVYSKYLENIVECKYDISGYPKKFVESLKILANMVYPLISRQRDSSLNGNVTMPGINNSTAQPFTNDMTSTLDQMRKNL